MQNIKLFRLFLCFALCRSFPPSFFLLILRTFFSLLRKVNWELTCVAASTASEKWFFFHFLPRIETRSRVVIVVLVGDIKIHFQIKFSFTFALRNVDEIKKVNWWHSRDFSIAGRVCVCETRWRWTQMELNWTAAAVLCSEIECCARTFEFISYLCRLSRSLLNDKWK